MITLSIERINIFAPYKVWQRSDGLAFTTENDIEYYVSFDVEDNFDFNAYWFNLTNLSHKKSPGDTKIAQTIIVIIEEFFRTNPDILLYICSTDKDQQAQRSRLFLRWFNGYEQQKHYFIRTEEVKGDGLSEYVSIIVQRTNPNLPAIIRLFGREVKMFNDNK